MLAASTERFWLTSQPYLPFPPTHNIPTQAFKEYLAFYSFKETGKDTNNTFHLGKTAWYRIQELYFLGKKN